MSLSTGVVKSCTAVTLGGAAVQVLQPNISRRSLTFTNDSAASVIYLAFTTSVGSVPSAVLNSGVRLNAAGGSFTLQNFSGGVSGIATAAGTVMTVLEV